MKYQQQGISLTGFIVWLGVIGFCLFIGMKLGPMYMEYWTLKKILASVAEDSNVTTDRGSIVRAIEDHLSINYSGDQSTIDGNLNKYVKIERADGGVLITIEYEARRPLIYNLDAVARFHLAQQKNGASR